MGGKSAVGLSSARRKRAFRANAKFYIFLGIVAAAVVLVWLYVSGQETVQAEQGSMDFAVNMSCVVVRDEEVITAETFGMAGYLVPDQQRVEADTPVVEIYKWGYNDKVVNDLVDVRTKILQYESTLHGASSQDLQQMNDEITDVAKRIREASHNAGENAEDAASLEAKLTALMDERTQYLRERVSDDQQLEDYRKQERQLEERVSSWRDVWSSPEAGVVSYYFDGYEPVINAENIREASVSQVRSILGGTLPMAQIAEGTEPLYRLVNNFQWYIVIPSRDAMLEFANDNTFRVSFEGYPDRQFEGTVIGNISEGDDHLYVMEFNEDIGSLVNTRRARARISTTFSGLDVPVDALKDQDGRAGVYVVENKSSTFVPVTVRCMDSTQAIVEPIDSGSALRAGAAVSR